MNSYETQQTSMFNLMKLDKHKQMCPTHPPTRLFDPGNFSV